jgi:hypothetical protein
MVGINRRKFLVVCQLCGKTGFVDLNDPNELRSFILKLRESYWISPRYREPLEYWVCRDCSG